MKYSFDDRIADYPHIVSLDPFNKEGLMRQEKLAILIDPVLEWLRDNFNQDEAFVWYYSGIIGFKSKEDALGFILRWA